MIAAVVAALSLATPVTCVNTEPAWDQMLREHDLAPSYAFYLPSGWPEGPRVYLGPLECRVFRRNLTGGRCDRAELQDAVFVLAHELEHALQDRQHRPVSEEQADRVGWLRTAGMLLRLERAFGLRCR